jgi:hypothetical protein
MSCRSLRSQVKARKVSGNQPAGHSPTRSSYTPPPVGAGGGQLPSVAPGQWRPGSAIRSQKKSLHCFQFWGTDGGSELVDGPVRPGPAAWSRSWRRPRCRPGADQGRTRPRGWPPAGGRGGRRLPPPPGPSGHGRRPSGAAARSSAVATASTASADRLSGGASGLTSGPRPGAALAGLWARRPRPAQHPHGRERQVQGVEAGAAALIGLLGRRLEHGQGVLGLVQPDADVAELVPELVARGRGRRRRQAAPAASGQAGHRFGSVLRHLGHLRPLGRDVTATLPDAGPRAPEGAQLVRSTT